MRLLTQRSEKLKKETTKKKKPPKTLKQKQRREDSMPWNGDGRNNVKSKSWCGVSENGHLR